MKKLSTILSIFLVSFALTLEAAQDSSEIKVDITYIDYVNFIGMSDGFVKYFTVDDIEPAENSSSGARLILGTFGLESNSAGDCDIQFSSQNDFKLLHTVTSELLTNYRILWKGNNIKNLPNRELTLPCNSVASNMVFQAVASFLENNQSGIYQDILTFTVTTQ